MNAWAMRIPLSDAAAAGALRLERDIDALFGGDALWLTGKQCDDALRLQLRKLAGDFFSLGDGRELIPYEHVLPVGRLPEGTWRPLAEVLRPAAPKSALPGRLGGKFELTVRRSSEERPATLLRVSRAQLAAFVDTAPAIRLRRLRFALSREAALIAGAPLPPIAGIRFAEAGGISVPCGYRLHPLADERVIASLLELSPGDVALFDLSAAVEIVRAESFVSLTRAAARLSLAGGGA
jgi:hypothetical protein